MNSLISSRWSLLRYHPIQQALWTSKARFKLVTAGRSSGKTELAKRKLVISLADYISEDCPNPLYFAAGPTYNQIKRVWWDDLKNFTPSEWVTDISESELSITTRFGSKLYLVGLDKPMRIEGSQYCGGVVDESCDIKPGTFSRSIRPALSQYRGWCWRIGVPKRFGVGASEFKQGYEAARDGLLPDSEAFWWKSEDILTPEEILAAKIELSEDDYREQYGAEWLLDSGLLFSAFSTEHNVKLVTYDKDKKIYVGCDFNVNPMAWVLGHKKNRELHVFDELFIRNINTQDALTLLWNKYPKHESGWVFMGDAASKARKTSATQTDYAIIYNDQRFVNKLVLIGDRNPNVQDRIAATNRQLRNAQGMISLFVDDGCKHLLEDLRLRSSVESVGDIGHMSDALGYVIWTLWPLKPELQSTGEIIIGSSSKRVRGK